MPIPDTSLRWLRLLALSLLLSGALVAAGLPAAWLLGAMVASIVLSVRGLSPALPRSPVSAAQGMVGLLIASGLQDDAFHQLADHALLFGGVVAAVILLSVVLGACLVRLGVMPGTSALWGVFPGAASAMTVMAEAHGADVRYVALMQYLRVAIVVMVATTVMHAAPEVAATAALPAGAGTAGTGWMHLPQLAHLAHLPQWAHLPAFDAVELLKTLLLAAVATTLGERLRWPAGALLVPMAAGVAVQHLGWVRITQPAWLMVAVYSLIGWSIGRRFSREMVRHAWRSLPWLLASIAVLVLACAALGWALTRWCGIDPLTAYLATSPGGIDAVAILAASAPVDLPFVMGLQTARLLAMLLLGPAIVRGVVHWMARSNRARV